MKKDINLIIKGLFIIIFGLMGIASSVLLVGSNDPESFITFSFLLCVSILIMILTYKK